ncbi:MAG: sugar ABC transporter substrate-binding protein [Anaerolineales bacterium]|nr:sugar ABC transporter substrate-binding protein [Anaerolineales bacterium]
MKTQTRLIVFALALVLAMGILLTGCGGTETAVNTPTTQPTAVTEPVAAEETAVSEPVELILYTSSGLEWLTFVAEEFEKTHPNITVNLVNVNWDEFDTKMIAMNTAGTPPDLWTTWGPSGFKDYYARGLIADLSLYIERDNYDMSDFFPQVVEYFTIDGKIYGMPHTLGASYIFYNKDMFDAAGLDYPPTDWSDRTWTWDKMLADCAEIAYYDADDAANSTWCISRGLYPINSYAWLWGKDIFPASLYETGYGEEANLSDPELLEIFQQYQDITYKYHYDQTGPEWMATGGDPFVMGRTAMQMWGVWGFDNTFTMTDYRWGIAAVPFGNAEADRTVAIWANPWMMSSQSAHPDEAWELLKFLSSPEMHRDYLQRGATPLARQSLMPDFYAMIPYMTQEEIDQVLNGALEYGRIAPSSVTVGWGEINNILGTAFDAIENGTDTAANTLPGFEDELIAKLKEIQETYQK